jgi:hypothetical protein
MNKVCVMSSNSTYDVIRSLLESGVKVSFTSDAFSHGQGASVTAKFLPKERVSKVVEEELLQHIFDFMRTFMEPHGVSWVGDFTVEPSIDDDGMSFFVDYDSSNDNYWEVYDPIYQKVVDISSTLENLFIELGLDPQFSHDSLELSLSLQLETLGSERLRATFKICEDLVQPEDKKKLQLVTACIPELERKFCSVVKSAVAEHNEIVRASGIEDFRYLLKVDYAPLLEGLGDYLEHSADYFEVIEDGRLRALLTEKCSIE